MALSVVTGVVSLLFAGCVLGQFIARRRPYQAAWTLGLVWYAIGALTEFSGARFGWTPSLYAWWYLAGAVCVAAYLGLGVVFLLGSGGLGYLVALAIALGSLPALATGWLLTGLAGLAAALAVAAVQRAKPEAVAGVVAGLLAAGTVAAAAMIFAAHIDAALLPAGDAPVTGAAAPGYVRVLTPLFNVPGAAALLGGALSSAWRFWRQGARPDRVVSNVLITLGAFVDSGASSLARLGWPQAFYAGQLLGVVLIFAGFLATVGAIARVRPHLGALRSGEGGRTIGRQP